MAAPEVWLVRHGETAWTLSGQHTGRSDIPLTPRGEEEARRVGERLTGIAFSRVFTSPLGRARRTCERAGYGDLAQVDDDLAEWDYGVYDGRTRAEILAERPGWDVFVDGAPGGESVAAVEARADRLVARLNDVGGRTLLFGHGHFLRALAVRWIGLPVGEARHFLLETAGLSILGHEAGRDDPAISLWNDSGCALG